MYTLRNYTCPQDNHSTKVFGIEEESLILCALKGYHLILYNKTDMLSFVDALDSVKKFNFQNNSHEEKDRTSIVLHYFTQGDRLKRREQCQSSSSFSQISGTSETLSRFSETHQKKGQNEVFITFVTLRNMLEMKVLTVVLLFRDDRTSSFQTVTSIIHAEDGASV